MKVCGEPHLHDRIVIDLAPFVDRSGVDLQDLKARLLIRQWNLNLPVEPTRPQ
jgi:hypothetical protein